VTWSINDGKNSGLRFELPQAYVDCDPSFPLSLEFVKDPGILESCFTDLKGFFLKFVNCTLVDAPTLVNEMACCGRFTTVNVSDYN